MPVLDGVRGLAILGVLLHHTRHSPFLRLHGFRGVWLFFVLSGFLITTLALREEEKRGRLDLGAFMIRRVFRIMPLFYLALLAYLCWASLLGMEPHGALLQRYLLAFVLYCPEFPIMAHKFAVPFAQSWSLGIEEKFYLLWPLLGFVWLARSRRRVVLALVLLGATLGLAMRGGTYAQMWGSYSDILIGCLLALLMHERRTYDYLCVLGRNQVTWGVLGVLALTTLSALTGTQAGERIFSALCALTIAALVTNGAGSAARLAGNEWLRRLGIWSYAVYLTHPILLDVWDRLLPVGKAWDILTLPLALVVDLPLCFALHIYVEKPLIVIGRNIAQQRRQGVLEASYE